MISTIIRNILTNVLVLMIIPYTRSLQSIYEGTRHIIQNPSDTAPPFFYYPVNSGYIYQDLSSGKQTNTISIYSQVDGLLLSDFTIHNQGSTEQKIMDIKVLTIDSTREFVIALQILQDGEYKSILYIIDEDLKDLYVTENAILGEFHSLRVLYDNRGFLLCLKNRYFATYDSQLNALDFVGGLTIPGINSTPYISGTYYPFQEVEVFGIFYELKFFIYDINGFVEYSYSLTGEPYPGGKWEQSDYFRWIGGKSNQPTKELDCIYLGMGGNYVFDCAISTFNTEINGELPTEIAYTTNENSLLNVYEEEGVVLKYIAFPYYKHINHNYYQLFLYNQYTKDPEDQEAPPKKVIFTNTGTTVDSSCYNYMYNSHSPTDYPEMLFLSKCGSPNIYIYYSEPIWDPKIKLYLNSVEVTNNYFPGLPREGPTPGSIQSCEITIKKEMEPATLFSETTTAKDLLTFSKVDFGNNLNLDNYSIEQTCSSSIFSLLILPSEIAVNYEGRDFLINTEVPITLQLNEYDPYYEDYEGTLTLEDNGIVKLGPITFKKWDRLAIPANSEILPGEYNVTARISFFTLAFGYKSIIYIYDFSIISHKPNDLIPVGEDLKLEILFLPTSDPNIKYTVTTELNNKTYISTDSTLMTIKGNEITELKEYTIKITTNIYNIDKIISFALFTYSEPNIKLPESWARITAGEDLGVSLEYDPQPDSYTVQIALKGQQGETLYSASVEKQTLFTIPGEYLQVEQNYEILLKVIVTQNITSQLSVFVTTIPSIPPAVNDPDNPLSVQIISSNTLHKYSTSISHRFLCKSGNNEESIKSYQWNIQPPISIEVNGEYMEIPPNQLLNSKEYQVECIARNAEKMTSAQLLIAVSPGITLGELVIPTKNIIGFQTEVNIYVTGVGSQSALTFLYIAKIYGQDEEYILEDWTTSKSLITTILNGIAEYNYSIIISIHCKNEYNERTSKSLTLQSKPSITESGAPQITQIISEMGTISKQQKLIELSKASSLLTQKEKGRTDDCGGCNIYNGYCDQKGLKCVCKEGFKYSVDCSLSDTEAEDLVLSSQLLADQLYETTSQISEQATIWGNQQLTYAMLSSMYIITSNKQINLTSSNKRIFPIMNNFTTYCSTQANKIAISDSAQGSLSSTLSNELTNKGFNIIDNLGAGITKETTNYTNENLINLQEEGLELSNILNKLGICKISTQADIMKSTTYTEKIEKLTYIWEGGKLTSAQMKNKIFTLDEYKIILTQNYIYINQPPQEMAVVNWKSNPLKGHPLSTGQLANTLEVTFYENYLKSYETLESPILLQFPLLQRNNSNNIQCVFFNESLQNYSNAGMEVENVKYSGITQKGSVTCLSTHLSMFTAGYWKTTNKQLTNTLTDNNLSKLPDEDQIMDYNPWSSFAFYICILIILVICIMWGIYRHRENKEFKIFNETPESFPEEKVEELLVKEEVVDKENENEKVEVGESITYQNEGKITDSNRDLLTETLNENCQTDVNLIGRQMEPVIQEEVIQQPIEVISEMPSLYGENERTEERQALSDIIERHIITEYMTKDTFTSAENMSEKEDPNYNIIPIDSINTPHSELLAKEEEEGERKNIEIIEENMEGEEVLKEEPKDLNNNNTEELISEEKMDIYKCLVEGEEKKETVEDEVKVENICLEIGSKEFKEFKQFKQFEREKHEESEREKHEESEKEPVNLPKLAPLTQESDMKDKSKVNNTGHIKFKESFLHKKQIISLQEARTIKILPSKPHYRYFSILTSVHNWVSPFIERQAWYRKSDRILVLGASMLITLWSTGIFWDPQEKSRVQDSFTFFGYICITLICIIFSVIMTMILKKLLCSIGANLGDIDSGIIHSQHKIRRIFGYILTIFIYLGCVIHINIMAVLFQDDATNKWMIVWLILVIENIFILQPIKAMFICLIYSPDLCLNPIGFLTGMKFATS